MPYSAVPWFWSDQGPLKLQIAGLTTGHDETVVRGDAAGISCSVFCFRGGRLLGVETVNRPADHMAARRLVGNRVPLTPAQAADESVDLKRLAAGAAATGA
jgi:3-phenylpropionate/trans-cinnamate dioxygenase ferredoxin reductase subunit